jgi:hypothetical protein
MLRCAQGRPVTTAKYGRCAAPPARNTPPPRVAAARYPLAFEDGEGKGDG